MQPLEVILVGATTHSEQPKIYTQIPEKIPIIANTHIHADTS